MSKVEAVHTFQVASSLTFPNSKVEIAISSHIKRTKRRKTI